MASWTIRAAVASLLIASSAPAQTSNDPFPEPIAAADGVITVNVVEFAALPDVDGAPARMMLLVDEPGTGRLFVNDMRGVLYHVSYDGGTVTRYLDLTASQWGLSVQARGNERGFQSFAFHPQFNQPGTPGFGKLYTYVDTSNKTPTPDFVSGGGSDAHDTILLEWTAGNPTGESYDGGPPRELLRFEQPFGNHNGGQLGFNPLASAGEPEFGLLYIGAADGGSGGDPLDLAQNLGQAFGKILRIDPLGSDSANGRYGIPADNPFTGEAGTLPEIYAYGVRNPQRFGWDPATGNMFLADIGQNIVEEISLVTRGANLGWNDWEGSYRFISRREVSLVDARGEAGLTYPVAEYGQAGPLAAAELGRDRSRRVSRRRGPGPDEPVVVRRQPQRRGLLCARRPASHGGTGCDPPGPVHAERGSGHPAAAHPGEEQGTGEVAGHARGPAFWRGTRGSGLPAEQTRRRHPPTRAVERSVLEGDRRLEPEGFAAVFGRLLVPGGNIACRASTRSSYRGC